MNKVIHGEPVEA